jgi:iron complex outermembrane receptor protein
LIQNPRVQSEIANIERVEVIKGPSGTLFGGTLANYGGVVNIVTKNHRKTSVESSVTLQEAGE